jgi:hypothetical protein
VLKQSVYINVFINLGTFPAKTTASNIFGSNITTTTTASNRFGTTPFNTSGGLFNQPLSTATTTVPVTTSVFGSNTTANLFSVNPVTTQSSSSKYLVNVKL